jgi:hypothetical protein
VADKPLMSDPAKPDPDPAAVWWGPQQPQNQAPRSQPATDHRPFQSFAQHQQDRASEWRWHYSKLIGVMYGPIPIGLIVAIPLLIWLWS